MKAQVFVVVVIHNLMFIDFLHIAQKSFRDISKVVRLIKLKCFITIAKYIYNSSEIALR